ncbi:MAG: hypothetical protein IJR41_01235 [Atopobiaceae bacterium]|nr:hypothetical protein [Atopobiaceae bacterium]
MAKNNTADVSNVKGVLGGYGFSAPIDTELDLSTDPYADLSGAFENMGFISEDGIEEEVDADTKEIVDMNGDVIFVAKSSEKETLTLTLVSITDASLREWHGHSNVDATAEGYIEVKHSNVLHDQRKYIFELLLKDGRKWRKYVPNGQVTEVGSIVHGAADIAGREITISCMPDEDGIRVYDFIEKAESGETGSTTAGA